MEHSPYWKADSRSASKVHKTVNGPCPESHESSLRPHTLF